MLENKIIFSVSPVERKTFQININEKQRDWYSDKWRFGPFLIEAKAEILFTLLESFANYNSVVADVIDR